MPDVNAPEFWEEIYRSGDARWDLKSPTPVFVGLLDRKSFLPSTISVLGCGKGYDAVYFARQGFNVTAVDFAESAITATEENARQANVKMTTLKEDVFLLAKHYPSLVSSFDYILEYTCFCAIDVHRRSEYINIVRSMLKPGGILIGLFFPIDDRDGGPPFAMTVDEITSLFQKDFILTEAQVPLQSVSPRRGKEILMVWKKR